MLICKKVNYKFQILNAILNYLVCNMIEVFTRISTLKENYYDIQFWKKESFYMKRFDKRMFLFTMLAFLLFTCHIWNMREVLVSCREKGIFFIADFHVLGLFMAKKHDLSEKKIPSAVAVRINFRHAYSLPLKS
jgi:hypothetical protein